MNIAKIADEVLLAYVKKYPYSSQGLLDEISEISRISAEMAVNQLMDDINELIRSGRVYDPERTVNQLMGDNNERLSLR